MTTNNKDFRYVGDGYSYSGRYVNDELTVKLRLPRRVMNEFVVRVGRINSIGSPGLEVLEQSSGSYLVCSLRPGGNSLVLAFVARLNRWMLTQRSASSSSEPTVERERRVLRVPAAVAYVAPDVPEQRPVYGLSDAAMASFMQRAADKFRVRT